LSRQNAAATVGLRASDQLMDHTPLHAATPRTSVAVVGRWYTAIYGQMDVRYTRRPTVGCRRCVDGLWAGRGCIAVACYVRRWITWTQHSEQLSNYSRYPKSRADLKGPAV